MLLCIAAFADLLFFLYVGMTGEPGIFQKPDCRAPWVIQSVLSQKQEESVALGINSCERWISRVTCQDWTIDHRHIISVFSEPVTVLQLLSYEETEGYLLLLIYPAPTILTVLYPSFALLGGHISRGERHFFYRKQHLLKIFLLSA